MVRVVQRRDRDERGAFLVLFALLLVALMTMAAIVIDLGQVRADKRQQQSLADFAALAAGQKLSGRTVSPAARDPRGACKDAVRAIIRNGEGVPNIDVTPCDSLPAVCDPSIHTSAQSVTFPDDAPYDVLIEYPLWPSDISDSRFAGGATTNDGTNPCSRMRVTVSRPSDAFFRGVIGADRSTVTASAVIRGELSQTTQGVAALLLLQRTGCGSLNMSGQGGVVVQYASNSLPGRIQADSSGLTTGPNACTTNNNADGWVVYGTARPPAAGGGPSVIAQDAPDGTVGILGVYAAAVGGRAGYTSPTGIVPAPTPGGISSRKPVDDKYNNAAQPSGAAIDALRTTVSGSFGTPPLTVPPWTTVSGGGCTNPPLALTGDVYVNCDHFRLPQNTTVVWTGANFRFTGKVEVPGNSVLALPNANTVYVRGCVTGCNGAGNRFSLKIDGALRVNTGDATGAAVPCTNRAGPGAGGTTTNKAVLAVVPNAGGGVGPFLVNGAVSLCQTFVYMGEVGSPQQVTSGGNCTPELPCPRVNAATGDGYILMASGGASADWSAPNQLTTDPTSSDPFEDLAYWQESSVQSEIKAQGTSRTEGVFFLPNAPFRFTGQATQAQPLNAQFIAYTLEIAGQGELNLKPNPADSVKIPVPGLLSLIR